MRIIGILLLGFLFGCGESNPRVDQLTLEFINAKIYQNSPVVCKAKVVSDKEIFGCNAVTMNGPSNIHLFMFENGKFKAINGTARAAVESHFNGSNLIELAELPLPDGVDITKLIAEFK